MMVPQKSWHVSAGKSGRDYSDIFLDHDVMFIGPGDGGPYPATAYERSVDRLGRADLAAFDAPSRAPERCVMLCEAKGLASGLGDTLPQPIHYASKLPNCRRIVTTQGSRFGIYLRRPDGSWLPRPDHYLNVARLRTQHAFPRGTNAVAALLALTPAAMGAAFAGADGDARPGADPDDGRITAPGSGGS